MKRSLTTILAIAAIVVISSILPKPVEAAAVTLSGYAWSENTGWINFKGSNYGVIVDNSTGNFSGYAWTENIGWLSFNAADVSGCPSGSCTPNVVIATGVVSGWAKILSTGAWVHLAGSGYGVTYSNASSQFSGYAWGDTDVGWIHFSGPGYGVVSDAALVPPPGAPSNLAATATSQNQINLTWADNSNNETGFLLERKVGAAGTYSQVATPAANATTLSNTGLTAGTVYYYRIRSTNAGGSSAYSNEANATTFAQTSTINVATNPSTGPWTINPGGLSGTGSTPPSVSVTPSGAGTTYTITPGSISGYDFPPTITNTLGGGSSVTLFGGETVGFTLTYAKSFDYTLSHGSLNPDPIQKGGFDQYGQIDIIKTIGATNPPTKSVDLSLSGVPSGVSYGISAQTCSPTCSSTITFTVTSAATSGTYPITVTGSPLGKTTSFNLNIINSPDMFVSCAKSPSSALVGQEVTWTATASGGVPPYSYQTWSTTPNQITPIPSGQSFTVAYSTTGTKTADATVRDSKGNVAHCIPVGTINIGVNPSFQEF